MLTGKGGDTLKNSNMCLRRSCLRTTPRSLASIRVRITNDETSCFDDQWKNYVGMNLNIQTYSLMPRSYSGCDRAALLRKKDILSITAKILGRLMCS